MKYLALDMGEKRIGVAKSDDSGIIAIPYGIIEVGSNTMENLGKIIAEEKPDKIILGIPRHANGDVSVFAEHIRDFAGIIRHEFHLETDFEDEFGTTIEATKRLKEAGIGSKMGRKLDDAMAAEVILESYLRRKD